VWLSNQERAQIGEATDGSEEPHQLKLVPRLRVHDLRRHQGN
jgi:hypothetical protein